MSLLAPVLALAAAFAAPGPVPQDLDDELEALLAEERAEADRLRRRGDLSEARRLLEEHLLDEPADALSRALMARVHAEESRYDRALADARRALEDCLADPDGYDVEDRRTCRRQLAELYVLTGRADGALSLLETGSHEHRPEEDPRDAWLWASARLEVGERAEAFEVLRVGAQSDPPADWRQLLAKARCQRALGDIQRASETLVLADAAARRAGGEEADVLAELGSVYFEGSREIEANYPAPGPILNEALRRNPIHEAALVELFELHRFNFQRRSRNAGDILNELLEERPDSIPGQLAALSADLDDGMLVSARARLARLEQIAPNLRAVRAERAALHWIQHERTECQDLLRGLVESDPGDSRAERVVGSHLNRLYRFAEALPFLRKSVERNPSDFDAWTELGRSLANTGRQEEAREALERASVAAEGRRDAWRENTEQVLERMRTRHTTYQMGDLTFSWQPDAAAVYEVYFPPFYQSAREELARRYGFTPPPASIQVFRRHADFSVRSTGFEGFPALGVCFGPVVTALSPLWEVRGVNPATGESTTVFQRARFNWAETAFHEFSHVVHLGLSHNRCPRWITEGLATWEEENKNPTWTRNMRRELVDSRANDDLIRVRDLNRAFRTNRIMFAYYQGGLLCKMLIDEHGFPPMVRLLEAFDRGLDLDQALAEVFGKSPEEIDEEFGRFVDGLIADLHVEPLWNPADVAYLRLGLEREAPADGAERAEWEDAWLTIGWSGVQQRRLVDAETAIHVLLAERTSSPRFDFLRGTLARARGELEEARFFYESAIEAGGEDYLARFALADFARREEEYELAIDHYLAAEAAFPGYADRQLSAELGLANLYDLLDRTDGAMRARERWLRWNSGDYATRVLVAGWHAEAGRFEEAARLYQEANEVDPFRRRLHERWGLALLELERFDEALREFEVTLAVAPELEGDELGPVDDAERARLLGNQARALVALGRLEEARGRVDEALELDEDCEEARRALEELE